MTRPLPLPARLAAGLSAILGALAWAASGTDAAPAAQTEQGEFRAGAARVDISPDGYPVIVNAMFTERSADRVVDPLEVCAIVLDDGNVRVAVAVVDSCMVPRGILDAAKEEAGRATGIPVERMLVSSTHTHSAPSAMACLGSRVDPDYAALLPGRIAEAIIEADRRLEPARAGWVQVDDWDHTFNRRWIRRPDRLLNDPFGRPTVRAHMHPGHESGDVTGPSGPVDPGLTVLSIEAVDGRPLGLLANYSQHYYGSPLLSSDYYGRFRRHLAEAIGGDERAPGFVPIMCQGTSGDLMWMDYSGPSRDIGYDAYAREMAERVLAGIEGLVLRERVPLAMAERTLRLGFRLPDPDRLAWAGAVRDRLGDRLPQNLEEIYALEALHLDAMREAEIKLQALRVGELGITALPNEVFALTGLKLKAQSPLPITMNISLANGASGYIPPPEQHALGGYTTWPARTAGLEVEAEPRIVDALLDLLEEVADGRARREIDPRPGPAAQAVLDADPLAYWRLDDAVIPAVRDGSRHGRHGRFEGGVALYLPGVGSGIGLAPDPRLVPSPFAAGDAINRAVHLAGGHVAAELPLPAAGDFTAAFWFWNGLPSDAREVNGILFSRLIDGNERRGGEVLGIGGTSGGAGALFLRDGGGDAAGPAAVGETVLRFRDWHHVAIIRQGDRVSVHLDGAERPEIVAELPLSAPGDDARPLRGQQSTVLIGAAPDGRDGFEGRIDEAAVFGRALQAAEIASQVAASGVAAQRARAAAERERALRREAERARMPLLPDAYADAVLALRPSVLWTMDGAASDGDVGLADASGNNVRGIVEAGASVPGLGAARHAGGRIRGSVPGLGADYSVAFWFRSDLPNDARPVAAYLFSRGPDGADGAPGEHLGIGGTYRPDLTGRLIVFNGNARDEVVAGRSIIAPGTWNFVVLSRHGRRVGVFLNGAAEPEIDAELEPTFAAGDGEVFLGGRSDRFAPLDGWIGAVALFPRALSGEAAIRLHSASGVPAGTAVGAPASAAPDGGPESLPLEPADSLARIHVRDGYRVELAASEPLVLDPVAFDWDGDGRLWVVEMADYPLGIDGAGKPGGRVRVLEDTDDDGRYDRSSIFADGLTFPNGILTWRDGVLVTAAPDILFLRDTDGDGVADEREVLYSGFLEGNQQLRVNGLRWGLDNWVYCGAGGHHGGHGAGTEIRSHRTGEVVAIGSRDCRIRPDTGEIEPASGPTQFGRNRDPWGRWFGTQNSWPLWHYVLPDRYLRRNPHVPAPSPVVQLVVPMNPPVFPASRPEKRYHSFAESGRFTSACSGMIYGDALLFGIGDGVQHGFICEPFHNLVHHAVLRDAGATFTAARAEGEAASEFIAGEDRWFRPVMTRTGPDGALWVADMCRYMIEHPEWLPAEGKEELLPDYRKGDDRGRIYRVVPEADDGGASVPKLGRLPGIELVGEFRHPNAWRRDKAQMLLGWRDDVSVVPALRAMADADGDPLARLHALCTLDALGALDAARVRRALADPVAGVRENALRLAESFDDPEIAEAAAALTDDRNAKVRLQLAFSLGEWDGPAAGEALGRLAVMQGDDPHLLAAVMSSAIRHPGAVARAVVEAGAAAYARLAEPLVQLATALGEPDALRAVVTRTFSRLGAEDGAGFGDPEQVRLAVRILDALSARGLDLAGVVGEAMAGKIERTVADGLGDASAASESRVRIGSLAARLTGTRERAVAAASELWLDARQPPEIQREAVAVIAASRVDAVAGVLLGRWDSLGPVGREAVVEALLADDEWTLALLEAANSGSEGVGPGAFGPAMRSRLLGHGTPTVREAAQRLFRDDAAGTRAVVVDRFRAALDLAGDPAAGAAVFARLCAVCHRRGNAEGGIAIGPDLISVREHAPEKLLVNILDPNASVEPGYHGYHCTLNSGEQLYGLIASETANSVNLKLADGSVRSIARDAIRALRSSRLSLMPEGLESGMSIDDLADLLAYLRSAE